jgi:hypothetical protein
MKGGNIMKYTEHALRRKSQRNFSHQIIEIILNHGRATHALGGAMKVYFGKKESCEIISEF